MVRSLSNLVGTWCDAVGVIPRLRPSPAHLDREFARAGLPSRPGVDLARITSWERRFGFLLPEGLKHWLRLSNGLYAGEGPLIHPLSAIGPMVPFAPIPGLAIQPESWFELGNPNRETVCIDLGYCWPEGDFPLFASGDDERRTRPRLIATAFDDWFLRVLHRGGAEYWLEPDFVPLGDPWAEHRRRVALPPLSDVLRPYLPQVHGLLKQGADDGSISRTLHLSRSDTEFLVRHIQHGPLNPLAVEAEARS